ncbi:MAG: PPC domain-containing protein [Pirellulales bacterium]
MIVLFCLSATAYADEPTVSYIFPAGGQQGTSVTFRVGGHYLHESASFEMLGQGVTTPNVIRPAAETIWFEGPLIPLPDSQQKENYPKDYVGEINIAENATVGSRRWRVWTSQAATPSRPFVVGDLPEVIEQEIDGRPIPVVVQPPVTVNGRIFPREDIDVWSFEAKQGENYTCEVVAARLGSPLDSRLEIHSPDNKLVAVNTDTFGTDSFVSFVAPQNGTYHARIYDINFGGLQHYIYRLTIRSGPYIEHVFPLGGRRGESATFKLYGRGIGDKPSTIKLPATGNVFRHHIYEEGNAVTSFPLQLGDFPEFVESAETSSVTPPAILNGVINEPGEVDSWQISGRQDAQFVFDLQAARLGSHLDSVLTIFDAKGKQLAQSDDISSGQTDSQMTFKFSSDESYTVQVADRLDRRGGPRFAYRLVVRPPSEPGFRLLLPSDAFTVLRGGENKLKVTADREGGFAEAIKLEVENLPAGVTVADTEIAKGKNDAQLVFKAAENAAIKTARLKILGTATVGGRAVRQLASTPTALPLDTPLDHIFLAVGIPTPFKVKGIFETKFAARGSTLVRHYSIDRGGFKGPLTIRLADRQVRHLQGVTGPTIVLPAGKSKFDYPIQLAPWMELGRTSRTCVMAIGVIEEASGSRHTVSYTSHEQADQIIALVDPGQLAIRVVPKSLLAKPKDQVELQVNVGRGNGIDGPVRVELIIPSHIRGILSSPAEIPDGESAAKIPIRFNAADLGPFNMPLTVRATARVDGRAYLAEVPLDVRTTHD